MTSKLTQVVRRANFCCGSVAVVALVVACGGGHDSASSTAEPIVRTEAVADTAPTFRPKDSAPPSAQTVVAQCEGARLNNKELAQIAKTGVLPKAFDGRSLSGAAEKAGVEGAVAKSAASRVPTHRFSNTRTSAHFFTTSEAECANVVATVPVLL